MYILEAKIACETPTFLRLFLVLGKFIDILKLVVPIVLVVIATVEVVKMVLGNEEKVSKSLKRVSGKFIAAVLVFFVPPIVNYSLESFVPAMAICYDNANIETIKYFEEVEKNNKKAIDYSNDGNTDGDNNNGGIKIPGYGSGYNSSRVTAVVATWNIGRGNKVRGVTATKFANVIKENNIDIIGIQEAKNNGTTLISNVANKNGMKYYFTDTPAGNAVLSKYSFVSKDYYTLVACAERRTLQKTVININGVNVSFYNVHISYQEHCPKKQIKDVYNKIKNDPNPFILVGDFNVKTKCSIIRDIFGVKYPIIARDTINNGVACTDSIIISSDRISVRSTKTIKTDGIYTDHNMVISVLDIRK